jgi:hypothetical protein
VKLANIGARAALVLGGEIADIAKLSSGRFGPHLMTMTWPGPPAGVGACHNQPTRRKFQRSRRTATTMIRIASG